MVEIKGDLYPVLSVVLLQTNLDCTIEKGLEKRKTTMRGDKLGKSHFCYLSKKWKSTGRVL